MPFIRPISFAAIVAGIILVAALAAGQWSTPDPPDVDAVREPLALEPGTPGNDTPAPEQPSSDAESPPEEPSTASTSSTGSMWAAVSRNTDEGQQTLISRDSIPTVSAPEGTFEIRVDASWTSTTNQPWWLCLVGTRALEGDETQRIHDQRAHQCAQSMDGKVHLEARPVTSLMYKATDYELEWWTAADGALVSDAFIIEWTATALFLEP